MVLSEKGREHLAEFFADDRAADMIDWLDDSMHAKALLKHASCKLEVAREDYTELDSEADRCLKAIEEIVDEVLSLLFG